MYICIFGDSIVWGAAAINGQGWVDLLKYFYIPKYETLEVYNVGVTGDTTSSLLKRFKVEADAREPNVIIFAIGINDTTYIKDEIDTATASLKEFEENLNTLIYEASKFTEKIIFIGLTRVNEALVQPYPYSTTGKFYSNAVITQFDGILQKVAREKSLVYVNMSTVLSHSDLEDGLHPNAEGHKKMFEVIRGIIEPLVSSK